MNSKKYGQKKEKEYDKKNDDFKLHRSSGSSRFEEADGHNDFFIEDIKSTEGESIKVTREMLEKIEDEANRVGKAGIITLQFKDRTHYIINSATYYILKELLELYGENK